MSLNSLYFPGIILEGENRSDLLDSRRIKAPVLDWCKCLGREVKVPNLLICLKEQQENKDGNSLLVFLFLVVTEESCHVFLYNHNRTLLLP